MLRIICILTFEPHKSTIKPEYPVSVWANEIAYQQNLASTTPQFVDTSANGGTTTNVVSAQVLNPTYSINSQPISP